MPSKRPRAVVTMAHNENIFLPIWWKYYSRFFAEEDIYILDHESTDGSTSGPGFVKVPVSNPVVDWGWHRDMVQRQQHLLMEKYEMVLCTDADEIVAPHPDTGTLADYMNSFSGGFVNCTGYEVLHDTTTEQPFDFSKPILEQRRQWFYNPAYSKPLLATEPMFWHGGMHSRVDGQTREDRSLYLIHLHRMDFDICHQRHQQRMSRPWNKRDVAENWGYQNRITEAEQFRHWFYNDSSWGGVAVQPEAIPESFRHLI